MKNETSVIGVILVLLLFLVELPFVLVIVFVKDVFMTANAVYSKFISWQKSILL